MEQRILHLTLNKKWYDKIASGEKLEEYRDIKEYWYPRFVNRDGLRSIKKAQLVFFLLMAQHPGNPKEFWDEIKKVFEGCFKEFDVIEFRNGYTKTCRKMRVEFKGIEINQGNTEWGAEDGKRYFVLKLGKVL